jgi:hypothetical protein
MPSCEDIKQFLIKNVSRNCRVEDTGFHMMNLLRRFVDVFRMDAIDMNTLTGNTLYCNECTCTGSNSNYLNCSPHKILPDSSDCFLYFAPIR